MKELKNKSSVYIFPMIFYRLLEEGMDENIINHIHNTYLSDENDDFIIILDKVNTVNGSDLDDQTIASLLNCELVENKDYEELNERFVSIIVKKPKDINETINLFVKGKYSEFEEKFKRKILDFSLNYCTLNFYAKVGYVIFKNSDYRQFLMEEYGVDEKHFPEDLELDDIVNIKEELYDRAAKETIEEAYSEIQRIIK